MSAARDKAAAEVAARFAEKLFKGRKGHAATEGVSYRNLTRDSVKDVVEAAYKLGWDHAREFSRRPTVPASVGGIKVQVVKPCIRRCGNVAAPDGVDSDLCHQCAQKQRDDEGRTA